MFLGNDLLEDSPYEPVNSRLSDIFRVVPFIPGKQRWILLLRGGPWPAGNPWAGLLSCEEVVEGRSVSGKLETG